MKRLAPGSAGPCGMCCPDLPDEQETLVNPHYPAAEATVEAITACAQLEPAERQMLAEDDFGLYFSCVWPLTGRDELCDRIPFFLLTVLRDDRLDQGDTHGAAALDTPIRRELERVLATLPADSAQRIMQAATAEAGLVRTPVDSFASLDAYLEYQRRCDGWRLAAELAAAGAGRTYGPLLNVPEAQEFLRLNAALTRLVNDILGAPREMSQKGDRTNAVILQQRLTRCTPQQALDACLEMYHGMRERYGRAREDISSQEGFEQMCTDLHLLYSGSLFMTKRLLRYRRSWMGTAQ
ncbi:terpene synthase family protein [Streptomyces sp. NPDC005900]|uniref:terpene synthase family protein n=1 Tax=Streptomyces sp. NPDC005900 TaxID=3154569 RepID=UPI0033E904F9